MGRLGGTGIYMAEGVRVTSACVFAKHVKEITVKMKIFAQNFLAKNLKIEIDTTLPARSALSMV